MKEMKVDLKILEQTYNNIVEESNNIILEKVDPSKKFISLVHHYFLFGVHYSKDFMHNKSKELEKLYDSLTQLEVLPITISKLEKEYTPYFKTA
jgi:hypothetical protein